MFRHALRPLAPVVAIVLAASVTFAAREGPKQVIKDPTNKPAAQSPLNFTVKDIDGKDQNLAEYKGQVVLIVNVASKCGNTPQYKGLEALYEKYKEKGLVIVGFPANNFGAQEPGTNAQIKEFCTQGYAVSFPMMGKVSVKGADKTDVYKFLTEQPTAGDFGGDIEWNFTKFLVDRNGNVIARFANGTKPEDAKVVGEIEKALAAKPAK
jgi:glutathione peroxidase